jgi:hypothetical protein
MAGARVVSHMGDMHAADLMARKSGGLDVHPEDDFAEEYDKAQELIGVIHSLVDGLTFAPGATPSAPAPARKLGRGLNPRVIDSDGKLQPFAMRATGASLIAEDLVPPDYRVRTS